MLFLREGAYCDDATSFLQWGADDEIEGELELMYSWTCQCGYEVIVTKFILNTSVGLKRLMR